MCPILSFLSYFFVVGRVGNTLQMCTKMEVIFVNTQLEKVVVRHFRLRQEEISEPIVRPSKQVKCQGSTDTYNLY